MVFGGFVEMESVSVDPYGWTMAFVYLGSQ